jgi:hypothetical protein
VRDDLVACRAEVFARTPHALAASRARFVPRSDGATGAPASGCVRCASRQRGLDRLERHVFHHLRKVVRELLDGGVNPLIERIVLHGNSRPILEREIKDFHGLPAVNGA